MSARLFPTHRVLWLPLDSPWQPPSRAARHCCRHMEAALEFTCEQHHDPFDCPDTALIYHEPFEEYGIPVSDGGQSYLTINHCPFCGTALPSSGRDAWFDALETAGLDEEAFDALPEKFRTAAWRNHST